MMTLPAGIPIVGPAADGRVVDGSVKVDCGGRGLSVVQMSTPGCPTPTGGAVVGAGACANAGGAASRNTDATRCALRRMLNPPGLVVGRNRPAQTGLAPSPSVCAVARGHC